MEPRRKDQRGIVAVIVGFHGGSRAKQKGLQGARGGVDG